MEPPLLPPLDINAIVSQLLHVLPLFVLSSYFHVKPKFFQNCYTHASDMAGVIVLTSFLCVCVCVLPLLQQNGHAYRLEFWHGGQVEGYLGQVYRSRP